MKNQVLSGCRSSGNTRDIRVTWCFRTSRSFGEFWKIWGSRRKTCSMSSSQFQDLNAFRSYNCHSFRLTYVERYHSQTDPKNGRKTGQFILFIWHKPFVTNTIKNLIIIGFHCYPSEAYIYSLVLMWIKEWFTGLIRLNKKMVLWGGVGFIRTTREETLRFQSSSLKSKTYKSYDKKFYSFKLYSIRLLPAINENNKSKLLTSVL